MGFYWQTSSILTYCTAIYPVDFSLILSSICSLYQKLVQMNIILSYCVKDELFYLQCLTLDQSFQFYSIVTSEKDNAELIFDILLSSQVKDVRRSSVECRTPPLMQFNQPSLPLHRSPYTLRTFCTEQNVQECLSHINQVNGLFFCCISRLFVEKL